MDTRPHFIVRRYAEFATALLVLTENYKHPDLVICLNQLREEMMSLLERLSLAVAPDPKEKNRRKQVFLITNLDVILSLLKEKSVVSTVMCSLFL